MRKVRGPASLLLIHNLLINIIDFKFTLHSPRRSPRRNTTIPIRSIRVGVTPPPRFRCRDMFFFNEILNFVSLAAPAHTHVSHQDTKQTGRGAECGDGGRGTNCLFLRRLSWLCREAWICRISTFPVPEESGEGSGV